MPRKKCKKGTLTNRIIQVGKGYCLNSNMELSTEVILRCSECFLLKYVWHFDYFVQAFSLIMEFSRGKKDFSIM